MMSSSIGVFDIRTANANRHAGNILWSRDGEEGRIVLVLIDHGYSLPENVRIIFSSIFTLKSRDFHVRR